MSAIVITVDDFRNSFKEFCDPIKYTECLLTRFLTQAQAYISTTNYRIKPEIRLLLVQLMAAHLITLSEIDPQTGIVSTMGGTAGAEISASVDGVSVSRQGQIAKTAFEQWIQSTGYGQQYWAILKAQTPLGIHYCGTPRAFGIR